MMSVAQAFSGWLLQFAAFLFALVVVGTIANHQIRRAYAVAPSPRQARWPRWTLVYLAALYFGVMAPLAWSTWRYATRPATGLQPLVLTPIPDRGEPTPRLAGTAGCATCPQGGQPSK